MKNRIPALVLCTLLALTSLFGCGREIETATVDSSATTAATTAQAETTTAETTESWTPTAEDYSKYYEDNGYLKGVTASDYIEVPDFSTYVIDESDLMVSDEQIDEVIDSFLLNYCPEQNKEKVIEDGDTVQIAYTGYVDGKTFDNGSTGSDGTSVTIGVTSYVDDFLEQLIGHKPGDDLSIEVTFPDDYSESSLAGKDAVFETTILYVSTVPELTEELMEEQAYYFEYYFDTEASTPEELRQDIYDTYYSYYLSNEVSAIIEEVIADVEVPDTAYDAAYNSVKIYAANYSLDVETLQLYYGYSDEEFEELIREDARAILLYQAIAEKEGWEISEEVIQEYVGDSYEETKESLGLGYLAQYYIYTKANNFIQDSIQIK